MKSNWIMAVLVGGLIAGALDITYAFVVYGPLAQAVGISDTYDGRAVALADLWNRGVLDAVVANQNGPLLVYKNTVAPENQWIEFDLEGTASNRSAIGAQVRVHYGGKVQLQEVMSQTSYLSANERRLHFGLGAFETADVEVRWPSGLVENFPAVPANNLLTIVEGSKPQLKLLRP